MGGRQSQDDQKRFSDLQEKLNQGIHSDQVSVLGIRACRGGLEISLGCNDQDTIDFISFDPRTGIAAFLFRHTRSFDPSHARTMVMGVHAFRIPCGNAPINRIEMQV